jgi:hypothetical protein
MTYGRVSSELLPDFVRLRLAAERLQLIPGSSDVFTWLLLESGSLRGLGIQAAVLGLY